MKKSLVMFITHDFKKVFESTLRSFDMESDDKTNGIVVFDAESKNHKELSLSKTKIKIVRTEISSYDVLRPRKSHNLAIQFLLDNQQEVENHDYFWFIENDVYCHGGIKWFIDVHENYDCDLMVPEYGLRNRNWCWLRGMRGVKEVKPIGVTAPIYRMSRSLTKFIVSKVADGSIGGMMESLLPHVCIENGYEMNQFIPDHMCSVNTFRSKFIDLIEKDILEGTNKFVENKLYHPIKI